MGKASLACRPNSRSKTGVIACHLGWSRLPLRERAPSCSSLSRVTKGFILFVTSMHSPACIAQAADLCELCTNSCTATLLRRCTSIHCCSFVWLVSRGLSCVSCWRDFAGSKRPLPCRRRGFGLSYAWLWPSACCAIFRASPGSHLDGVARACAVSVVALKLCSPSVYAHVQNYWRRPERIRPCSG